jgi:transposase
LTRVSDGKEVVPAAEFSDALKQFRKLRRLPERKAMENEVLREVVAVAKSRKWTAHSLSLLESR